MTDFKIFRARYEELFPNGELNPRLIIEEGCWYLCTDTAELFVGTNTEDGLTLKRVNEAVKDEVIQTVVPEVEEVKTTVQSVLLPTVEKVEEEIAPTVEELKAWVDNKDFLQHVDLTGYATEEWVEGQGYLTEHQDLSEYADKTYIADTYATKSALNETAEALERADADNKAAVENTLNLKADKTALEATDATLAGVKKVVDDFFSEEAVVNDVVDTLKEIAEYITTDTVGATDIAAKVGALESKVDVEKVSTAIAAETTRATGVESGFEDRIKVLEGFDHTAYVAADTALKGELQTAISGVSAALEQAKTNLSSEIDSDIEIAVSELEESIGVAITELETDLGNLGTLLDKFSADTTDAINSLGQDISEQIDAISVLAANDAELAKRIQSNTDKFDDYSTTAETKTLVGEAIEPIRPRCIYAEKSEDLDDDDKDILLDLYMNKGHHKYPVYINDSLITDITVERERSGAVPCDVMRLYFCTSSEPGSYAVRSSWAEISNIPPDEPKISNFEVHTESKSLYAAKNGIIGLLNYIMSNDVSDIYEAYTESNLVEGLISEGVVALEKAISVNTDKFVFESLDISGYEHINNDGSQTYISRYTAVVLEPGLYLYGNSILFYFESLDSFKKIFSEKIGENHNHDLLYDALGSAEAVKSLVENEIKTLTDTKADKSSIPTSLSQLTNDAEYITLADVPKTDLSDYYNREQIADKLSAKTDKQAFDELKGTVEAFLTGTGAEDVLDSLQDLIAYIDEHDGADLTDMIETIQAIENKLTLGTYPDGEETKEYATVKAYVEAAIEALKIGDYAKASELANYAKKSEIPTLLSAFNNDVGYLTEHQDISGKADKQAVNDYIADHIGLHDDLDKLHKGLAALTLTIFGLSNNINIYEGPTDRPTLYSNIPSAIGTEDLESNLATYGISSYVGGTPEYRPAATKIYIIDDAGIVSLFSDLVFRLQSYHIYACYDNCFFDFSGLDAMRACVLRSLGIYDNYYTKEATDTTIAEAIPTKVSDFTNDAGYLTELPAHTHSEYLTALPEHEHNQYLTELPEHTHGQYLTALPEHSHDQYLTEHQSLEEYAKKTEIPDISTKADIEHEHSQYLTEHQSLDGYATEEYVSNANDGLLGLILTALGAGDEPSIEYAENTEDFVDQLVTNKIAKTFLTASPMPGTEGFANLPLNFNFENTKITVTAVKKLDINGSITVLQNMPNDSGLYTLQSGNVYVYYNNTLYQATDITTLKAFTQAVIRKAIGYNDDEPTYINAKSYSELDDTEKDVLLGLCKMGNRFSHPVYVNGALITGIDIDLVQPSVFYPALCEYVLTLHLCTSASDDISSVRIRLSAEGQLNAYNVTEYIPTSVLSFELITAEEKADDIPFTEDMYVTSALGDFEVGENVKGLTVADMFAKLLGLTTEQPGSDEPPYEGDGIVDTIMISQLPKYQIDENGDLVEVPYSFVTLTEDEALECPELAGFYQILDAENNVIESGYHQLSAYNPDMPYMIALPNMIDFNTHVTVKKFDDGITQAWVDWELALTNDIDVIRDFCEFELGCEAPDVPEGYTLWADLENANDMSIYRLIINE